MDELEDLGDEFVEVFRFLSPFLEHIGNGVYRKASLWYEIAGTKYCRQDLPIGRLLTPAFLSVGLTQRFLRNQNVTLASNGKF